MVIIIESPNKIKKFKKYTKAKIFATVGHFKDLPKKEMGVDLTTYEPYFVEDEKKTKNIKNIIKNSENETVIIATDADREGYAIGKFIYDEVKNKAKKILRAEIREITEKGINEGIKSALPFEKTNLNLFEAWKARRVGDRIVGYIMSPLANTEMSGWGKENYSVGRVQSPAVRLVVEREIEIRNFVKKPYWNIVFNGKKEYKTIKAISKDLEKIFDKDKANKIFNELQNYKNKKAIVIKVEKSKSKRNPLPPFTTSTLQQSASSILNFSSEKTMSEAQKLFENGYITYHRVDSTLLSEDFLKMVKDFAYKTNLKEIYDKEKPYKPKKKGKENIQEAHEAIRPTELENYEKTIKGIEDNIGRDARRLYELIYKRALSSQMKPAIYDTLKAEIKIEDCPYLFIAKGRALNEKGFLSIYNYNEDKEKKEENLPSLEEGDVIFPFDFEKEEKETKPPPRYTEASLISKLEKEGIGRPSTYATIMSVIKKRGYVEVKNKKLYATKKGEKLIDWLKKRYNWLIEYDLTSKMEEYLDKIANGEGKYILFMKGLHKKMNFQKPNDNKSLPPSEKQINFAKKIAEGLGLEVTEDILKDRKSISSFIEENKDNFLKQYSNNKVYPLSEKQKGVIERNAPDEIKELLNDETPENIKKAKEWLNDYFKGIKK